MSETKLEIGIIGFGAMGTLHAAQIEHIDGVDIVAVVEPSQVNFTKAVSFFSGRNVQFFDGLEEALSMINPDGWIVTSSTKTHIAIAHQLLSLGHKVLLEKPLARSCEEARDIKNLVKSDSSNLMLGHILLWNQEFQALRAEVRKLGEILSITCTRERSAGHRLHYAMESPFSLIMVHDLYTVQSLFAGEQPTTFSAQVREHAKGGVDLAQAQLTWKNGAFASLLANYLIPDGIDGGGNIDEITVSGYGWRAQLMYGSGVITITTASGVIQVTVSPPLKPGAENYFDDALRREQEHFFEVISGKANVLVGSRYEDACQIQGWIDSFISLTHDLGAEKC